MYHWVKNEINFEIWGMHTLFDEFEWRVSQKLAGIQASNLAGMQEDLVML